MRRTPEPQTDLDQRVVTLAYVCRHFGLSWADMADVPWFVIEPLVAAINAEQQQRPGGEPQVR